MSVRVVTTREVTRLEFRARRKGVPPFRATLVGEDALRQVREELDVGLAALKDELPELAVEDKDLDRVFATLHGLGRTLLFVLFGARQEILLGLQDFWNRALPLGTHPDRPPLIECVGSKDAFLPLEFLPLFRLHPGDPISKPYEFLEGCRSLVGFSCVVRRAMLPLPLRGTTRLSGDAEGRVPLRYLHYEHLYGAQEELAWFSEADGRQLDLEGPYPDGTEEGPELAEQIFDPHVLLDGRRRELPDQIQHFACHCYTRAGDPLAGEIELSGGGHHTRTTLRSLGRDFVALAGRRELRTFDLPLVIMNACGSARMRAPGSLSFPHFFLMNGNRGFIGPETEIPDDVAAEFSKALYERLLKHRVPLGRAVLDARRQLLHTLRNPLGLAYAVYADPALHVPPHEHPTSDAEENPHDPLDAPTEAPTGS